MTTKFTHIAVVSAAIIFTMAASGCAAGSDSTPAPAGDATATQQGGGQAVSQGLHTSTTKVDDVSKVVLTTNKGVIEVTLRPDKAPNSSASFVELAESGFYDGTKFHRVEPGFVIQGGDPQTKDPNVDPALYGTGNPGWSQKAEISDLKHDRGVIAMARSQAMDSAGSQFYITLAPANFLDGQYTVFGKVIEGMDVVDKIAVGDTVTSVKVVRGK